MCFAGAAPDKDAMSSELAAERRRFAADPAGYGKNISGWGTMTNDQRTAWFNKYEETPGKASLGGDYIDPNTGRRADAPPMEKDLTDQLLQKSRTSFMQRLQMGKNLQSSFNGTQLGGSDLSKPILGGY